MHRCPWLPSSRALWRPDNAATHPAQPHLLSHRPGRFSQRHGWARCCVPTASWRQPPRRRRLRLPKPLGHRPAGLALRWPRFWVVYETLVARPLHLVAKDAGRTRTHVGSCIGHSDVAWRSRACPDGSGLATRRLRRGQSRWVRPGQPRRRSGKDCGAVFLEGHEVCQDIAPRIDAGGKQAGAHPGNIRPLLIGVEQCVVALPDAQLQRPFDERGIHVRRDD